MKERLKIGVIGLGSRGFGIVCDPMLPMEDVDIIGVCDLYEDRLKKAADLIEDRRGVRPFESTNYKDILELPIDAVLILTAWEPHIEIAVAAMKKGITVGMEVGGAYSIDDCWKLVNTYEETGVPCMLLENCCYGKIEMMSMQMAKNGFFGDIVYCEGGYQHDLRGEISCGEENRHYRLRNYISRNCENYPTHELGPIAKLLNINNGNRMLTLSSMASCSKGLHQYILDTKGADDKLAKVQFSQGDIVRTNIKCANGELISLILDTTLPRCYSRNYTVRGTKGMYQEDGGYFFKNGDSHDDLSVHYNNSREVYEKDVNNIHPLWRSYEAKGGHGGMDYLVYRAFVESVLAGTNPPIDIYDTAAWMCISTLSEKSIALGGMPVEIPDFTNGKWFNRSDIVDSPYSLDWRKNLK
ncbi:MAG: gfo/Idh/MocA family oxidoreductase [Ruminococcaceae bacterium]|nr:gfo/Idh/MocA family oxidoreductase [Oscillospiraceae bacterium]